MFGAKKRASGEELAKQIAQRIRTATRLPQKTEALQKIMELTHPDGVFVPGYSAEALISEIRKVAEYALEPERG
jgi:hypothetical protein